MTIEIEAMVLFIQIWARSISLKIAMERWLLSVLSEKGTLKKFDDVWK